METAPPSLVVFSQLAAFARILSEGGFGPDDEPDIADESPSKALN